MAAISFFCRVYHKVWVITGIFDQAKMLLDGVLSPHKDGDFSSLSHHCPLF